MPTNKLKAWVRYDGQKKIVPSSLILQARKPKVGTWEEVPTSLCCQNDPCPGQDLSPWTMVTGGIAGDGTVLRDNGGEDNRFTIIGPDDTVGDGWVYLKQYFPAGADFNINYDWTSFDDSGPTPPNVDWPVYWASSTEPTGIPANLTVRVGSTPASGTWHIIINPGDWFAIGIYSDDSCCGRGFLQIDII